MIDRILDALIHPAVLFDVIIPAAGLAAILTLVALVIS